MSSPETNQHLVLQVMHEGKLVPAEQIIDEEGNISFILKTD